MAKIAVIYYSSTGANYQLAQWAEEALKEAGAEVKLLKVRETAPMEAIESNPNWKKHYEETKDVPEASTDDLDWADGFVFSVPTRFGNVPAQVKQLLDEAGGLWAQGKLVNKVVTANDICSKSTWWTGANINGTLYIDVPLGSDCCNARLLR